MIQTPNTPGGRFLEVVCPAGLAGLGDYALLAGDLPGADLEACLDLFAQCAPGSRPVAIHGPGPSDLLAPEPLVVLRPLTPDLLAAFRTRGRRGLRTLVHPLPYAYPWAFWDFFRIVRANGHRLEGLGDFRAFADQVRACPYMREYSGGTVPASFEGADGWPCYRSPAEREAARGPGPIQTVALKLAEDRSRRAYALGTAGSPRELWDHFRAAAFERPDYMSHLRFEPGAVVLNLGVFTGHEIPYFFAAMQGEGRILNVDPLGDAGLHPYVRDLVRAFPGSFQEIRQAASDHRGTLTFGRYPDGQFFEVAGGAEGVPCLSLDDLVDDLGLERVDVIKVDVEGGEPRVLEGARRLLKRFRPQLAISIYHTPDHLHELPAWLMANLEDYDFFVDHHSYVRFESVLYAVPRTPGPA